MNSHSEPTKATVPEVDVDFFAEIGKVFDQYPDAGRKYTIGTLPEGVDLDNYICVARYEGGRTIIEYEPRGLRSAHHACCERIRVGGQYKCVKICPE